jgi:hypothetical protein
VAEAQIHSFFVDPKLVVTTPFDTTLFYNPPPELFSLISSPPDVEAFGSLLDHSEPDLRHHIQREHHTPTPVSRSSPSDTPGSASLSSSNSSPLRPSPAESSGIPRISPGPVLRCDRPGCHATFRQRYQLTRHQKQHAKPFKCSFPECDYSKTGFARRKDLNRHEDSTHQSHGSELLCPDPNCKRAAPGNGWPTLRRDNLLRHLSSRHPELYLKAIENSDERKSSS